MIASKYIKSTLISIFLVLSLSTFAQRKFDMHKGNLAWRNWFVKANIGVNLLYSDASTYHNDLLYKLQYENQLGFSLETGKWLTPWLGANVNFALGNLYVYTQETESFSNFYQYSGEIIFNLNQLLYPSEKQSEFYVYLKLGYGLINFNATMIDQITGDTLGIQGKYSSYGKAVTEWFIPVGLGGTYNIDENFGINMEAKVNFTNTDKLDASYANKTQSQNDLYASITIGLVYTFNIKGSYGSYWRPQSKRSNQWMRID